MRTKRAFCSARDQEITIAWPDAPLHPGQAMAADAPEPLCMELDDLCTGEMCAIFKVTRAEMAVRLVKAGLEGPESLRVKSAECVGCGRLVELKVVAPARGWCPDCHTIQPLPAPPEEDDKALAGA